MTTRPPSVTEAARLQLPGRRIAIPGGSIEDNRVAHEDQPPEAIACDHKINRKALNVVRLRID